MFIPYDKSITKIQWGKDMQLLYTTGSEKIRVHKGNVDNSFKMWKLPVMWHGIIFQGDKALPVEDEENKVKHEESAEEPEDDLLGWDK